MICASHIHIQLWWIEVKEACDASSAKSIAEMIIVIEGGVIRRGLTNDVGVIRRGLTNDVPIKNDSDRKDYYSKKHMKEGRVSL